MGTHGIQIVGKGGNLPELMAEVLERMPAEVVSRFCSARPMVRIEQTLPVPTTSGALFSDDFEDADPCFLIEIDSDDRLVLHLSAARADWMDFQEIRGMLTAALAGLLMQISLAPSADIETLADAWGLKIELNDYLRFKFGR